MNHESRHPKAERWHVNQKPEPAPRRTIGYLMVLIALMAFVLYGYRLYGPVVFLSVIIGPTASLLVFWVLGNRS
jgi:hypothetical protein